MTKKIRLARDQGAEAIQGALYPLSTTKIAIGAAATINSTIIVAQVVRLVATADCHVKFQDAADVRAASTDMLIKANQPEYFTLLEKQYISVIRDTGDGTLYVTVMI